MSVHEVIAFPDVEALLISHLVTETGEIVSTKVPNPRPDRFVQILRVGGARRNIVVDGARLTFECWDTDSVGASELARTVRAHVNAMPGRVSGVSRVEEASGPANLPDPTSQQARYTWTAEVDVRGSAI